MGIYNGCEVPEDLLYDVDRDVWVRLEPDDVVTLGMTDPAQTRCGKLVSVRWKAQGKQIRRGQSVATIESAKWVGPVQSPLTGEIVATNEETFRKDILIANKNPYGDGWLARLRPTNLDAERVYLLTGPEAFARYREKIVQHDVRCFRCAEGNMEEHLPSGSEEQENNGQR
jgi:glycine cleavage system H protein